jgi:acetyl esterase/lipase
MVAATSSAHPAPEHPYPAQREDAARALTALSAIGVGVESLTFAGDSAGAHLALTLALSRKMAGLSLPRALVLISPWADTTLTQLPTPERDSLLSAAWVRQVRDCVFTPAQQREPLASPVFADLSGLPPGLIQSAEFELLCNDARRLQDAMLQAGVDSQWEEAPGLWHDYHLNAGIVPEAGQAVARIGAFILSH